MKVNTESLRKYDTNVLAYIGDGVYELGVRREMIRESPVRVDKLHAGTVSFVRAETQAKIIKAIFGELSDQEKALVKRARNKKSRSRPAHTDPLTYRWATAFEALIGFLYLAGEKERLDAIMEMALDVARKSVRGHT